MSTSSRYNVTIGLLALLVVGGIVAFGYQIATGLGVTGMDNMVSWGLYIIMFMFFVGLSAGGLIVSSSATVFNIPKFKQVAKPATILSTVCIIIAGLFVLVDIGQPFRVFNLIFHAQFASPLIWDVGVIGIYLLINILYLYNMNKPNAKESVMRGISYIALPVAVLVHSITAWIFGLQIAREGWYSAIIAPLFVTSALDSGLALLIITLVLLTTYKVFTVDRKLFASLAGLMVTCLAVDAYLVFSEIITMAYPQEPYTMLVLNTLLKGSMAPFFWGQVVLGVAIPMVILLFRKNRENLNLVVFSSVLIIIGVFFKRVWLLLTSFIHPNVAGPSGVISGKYIPKTADNVYHDIWATVGQYGPTGMEIMITVGLVALGALMFILMSRRLLADRPQTAAGGLGASGAEGLSASQTQ